MFSFIHYRDLYSPSSRLLLRSAPDPCTAKQNRFQDRVGCVRINHWEQSQCQKKSIQHERTVRPTTENARTCLVEVRTKGTKTTLSLLLPLSAAVLRHITSCYVMLRQNCCPIYSTIYISHNIYVYIYMHV